MTRPGTRSNLGDMWDLPTRARAAAETPSAGADDPSLRAYEAGARHACWRATGQYHRPPTVRLAKTDLQPVPGAQRTDAPGLDVSGLQGVLSVDTEALTADVGGMCTYEDLVAATLQLGLAPLVVPQLKTITVGGAATGGGIESTVVPQRPGLRRHRRMDMLTGAGEIVTASAGRRVCRPLLRLRQFLRNPRLRDPAAGPAGTGQALRRTCGTCGSPTRPTCRRRSPRSSRPGSTTVSPSTTSTASSSPPPRVSDPGHSDRRPRPDQRLHRAADLLPVDPAARHRSVDHP